MCVCVCVCVHLFIIKIHVCNIYTWCIQYVTKLFFYRNLKLAWTLENSLCYCYTAYEMTNFYDFSFK